MTSLPRSRRPRCLSVLVGLVLFLPLACATADEEGKPRRIPMGHTGSFTSWWSDTHVREVGEYKDGQRNGVVTAYHPDGSLAEEGKFVMGMPSGRHVIYHPGGVVALVETVVDGVVHGQREEYDGGGRALAVQTFEGGKRSGPQRTFHPNGAVAQEGGWTDDLPSGLWRRYDEQGKVTSDEWFWSAAGLPVGYLETVYGGEGQITAQAFKAMEDEHWVGWRTFWHANGVQAGLVEYRDEVRDGRDLSWSETGLPRVEGQRRGDRRVGVWRMYDDVGQLVETRDHGEGASAGG